MEEKKEEVELTSEEKMKKKFGKYRKIMTVIEGFLMVVPIMVIVVAIIVGFAVGMTGTDEENVVDDGIVAESTEEEEELNWKTEILDVLDMKDDLENDEDYQKAPEVLKNLMVISTIIAAIAGYILAIIMVDSLAKIFGEVETKGTPFTEKNIKLLKRVHILSIVLWILQMAGIRENSIGLIFVLVISAMRSIFEYGYKLQKEADETI
ncbi:MAG: DUF2975 domain-containing protein [Clostridia bacterium]|nr:DUF2975 domain-containing protein [Clostridia bacterium]